MNNPRQFRDGTIDGVIHKPIRLFSDPRGWVTEIWRNDELESSRLPAMTYLSMTHPGISRGPHEHRDQTDIFAFVGPGTFEVHLWDNRPSSPTYDVHMKFRYGEKDPGIVIVPPGVVHGYRNISSYPAFVVNCPNQLYAGRGKKELVDEIRWEDRDSPFQL